MYNKKTIPLLYTAVFGFILINKPIFADTDAGSLLNREEEIYKFNKNPQKIPQIDKNKKSPPVRNSQSPTIFVKDFIFKGSITKFKKEIFRDLLKNYTNKKNTFEDLKYAAYLIQELYSEKGFFLAKAFLPEQEVNNQTIIIQINEGKLDKNKPYIFKKTNVRLYEDVISSYLDDALGGNLTSQSLERGLLNLNELPGLNVTSTITTGEEQGSSKIIVDVIEDDLVTGILSYDNYGNRYTGKERANVVIDINNPSKFGDKISFIKTINSSTNYDFTKILYEFPIQQSGLRGTVSYTDLDFEIGKEIKTNPVSKGTASTSNIGLVYPIQRRRESSILFRSNIERKDIYNEASGSTTNDKIIDNFNVGLTYKKTNNYDLGGVSIISIDKSFGDLDLSKVSSDYNNDQSATGAKTDGSFDKTLLNFYHIQKVSTNLNLKTFGLAQLSNKNLDSSEKLSLGGVSGVRAYPSGEASGDQGYKFSTELQTNLSSLINVDVLASVFYDYGKIQQYKDPSNITLTTPNKYSLSGWGVAFDFYPKSDILIKAGWSQTIGNNDGKSSAGMNSDGKADSSRVWLVLSYEF